jgi:hypothetical protein
MVGCISMVEGQMPMVVMAGQVAALVEIGEHMAMA